VRRRPAQDALDKAGQDTGELTERRRTCDHGGPRLRFARDGRCARCGRFTPVRRIPAGQRPAARRYPGHPFISLGLGIALFLLGAQAAPWLCVIAVVLVTSGVFRLSRGRR
jgi:hypothetical protein